MAATLREALYQRLSTDTDLQALLGAATAIHHQMAPAGTPAPYVIFSKQTGNPDWTFGTDRRDHLQRERWLVKAVCPGRSAHPAEQAADRIDELLHDAPLTLDAGTVLFCRRSSDVDYAETHGPDAYFHVGGIYRVDTDPS